MGDSLTSIGESAFSGCSGLTSVIIPDGVTSIGNSAFSGCSGLTSVTIPNSVTSIGSKAFYNTYINTLTIGTGILTIAKDAFGYDSSNGFNPIKTIWLTNTPPQNYTSASGLINYVSNDQYTSFSSKIIYPFLSSIFVVGGIKYVPVSPSDRTCDAIDCVYDSSSENVSVGKTVNYRNVTLNVLNLNPYTCYKNLFIKKVDISLENSISSKAFYQCNNIESAIISNGGDIEQEAFYQCEGLKTAAISNRGNVGERAFYQCLGLQIATISNKGNIGKDAFRGCNQLANVTISNKGNIGTNAFRDCNQLAYAVISNEGSIGDYAFSDCRLSAFCSLGNKVSSINNNAFKSTSLKELTIPSSAKTIGSGAFYNCDSLIHINIENGVEQIGASAFSHCILLQEIVIPNSVKALSDYLFKNCVNLQSVEIGKNVESLGKSVFENCQSLSEIVIPTSVISIGDNAFYDCKLTKVIIEHREDKLSLGVNLISSNKYSPLFSSCPLDSVYIGGPLDYSTTASNKYSPFYQNTTLRTVTLADNVDQITEREFMGCTKLQGIAIPSTVTSIGSYAFSGCSNMRYVHTGISTKTIGEYAFSNCTKLKEIDIQNGAKAIGEYAFSNCAAIDSIIIPKSVETINNGAFNGCNGITNVTIADRSATLTLGTNGTSNTGLFSSCPLDSVYIGGDLTYSYSPFRNNTSLRAVTMVEKETEITNDEFSGCTNLREFTIPNTVTTLGQYAFSGCTLLGKIHIGNGVKKVNQYAFNNCTSLDSILIPRTVTAIEGYAFNGCNAMKKVVVDDRSTVLNLGSNGKNPLFVDCPLDSVYIGGDIVYPTASSSGYSPFYRNTSLRSVHITDQETEISPNEFYGCTNLSRVSIGDGVTTIGNWAFSGCSSLAYFAFGTQVETIGNEAFSDCTGVTQVISRAAIPPSCGSQALDDINKWDCELTVPENAISAYQAADQWKEFFFVNGGAGSVITKVEGDANGDGVVDIADLALAADYIMGKEVADLNFLLADINGDDELDVSDIAAMANIILFGSAEGPQQARTTSGQGLEPAVSLPGATIHAGESIVLPIVLSNPAQAVASLQMDVILPQGVTVESVALADERRSNQMVMNSMLEDGSVRVLCFSPNNSAFRENEGAILLLTLSADDDIMPGLGDILLSRIILSSTGNRLTATDVSSLLKVEAPTGIATFANEVDGNEVYGIDGIRFSHSRQGVNIVRKNGKTRKIVKYNSENR